MKLPPAVRDAFREHGRRVGHLRAERLSPERRRAIARGAALKRWIRARFGEPSFAKLRLPGGDLVDHGLEDLASGRVTADSLLVALAQSRLRREGVPVPYVDWPDPDHRLYRLLESTDGELAHHRYLARLRLIHSFADACARLVGAAHA